MESPEKLLEEILDSILDGNRSPEHRGALDAILQEHPEMQSELIEQLRTHSHLQWHSKDLDDRLQFEAEILTCHKEALREKSVSPPGPRRQVTWAAAAILLCGALALWRFPAGDVASEPVLAQVINQRAVVWESGSSALRDGELATKGVLRNTAGEYTLRFSSGPIVEVVGPSSLEIESGRVVRLSRGQATAEVPASAKGFTIATPVVDVVDQGTRFGVMVDEASGTDVVVFEGKVDLERILGRNSKPRHLVRGEGVQVDSQGIVERIMQIARTAQGAWLPLEHPSFSHGVIRRVRDDIPPADGSPFFSYHVSYGGLREECTAYADNEHQWNGLTESGLPEFLLGADYVMTFNDYRYLQDFTMTIELARPANLYIFADDRVPPPEWLKRQFEDTGLDIGIDEGYWNHTPPEYEHLNVNTTDIGGGKSIDNVFSVWRRKCLDTSPVTLGTAGELKTEGHQGRSMYGIAATPL